MNDCTSTRCSSRSLPMFVSHLSLEMALWLQRKCIKMCNLAPHTVDKVNLDFAYLYDSLVFI